MQNEMLDLIRTRRSCRCYAATPVADELLQAVLEAGTFAPTAMGRQAPYMVAVRDEALRRQLTRMNAAVMGTDGDPYYGAPVIVLVFVGADERNGIQDATCVLQTLMLAAHAVGLATCWINREREMFDTPEGQALMQTLGLPAGLVGVGALSLGYRGGEPSQQKPRKADYFRIV